MSVPPSKQFRAARSAPRGHQSPLLGPPRSLLALARPGIEPAPPTATRTQAPSKTPSRAVLMHPRARQRERRKRPRRHAKSESPNLSQAKCLSQAPAALDADLYQTPARTAHRRLCSEKLAPIGSDFSPEVGGSVAIHGLALLLHGGDLLLHYRCAARI